VSGRAGGLVSTSLASVREVSCAASGSDAALYCAAIEETFPELAIETIEAEGEGWDSVAWTVNGQYVFRFPKRDDVVPWLEREIALLPELAPTLPLPVPRFSHVCIRASIWPRPFVGYRRLAGQPLLDPPMLARAWPHLADQLGSFLAALHAFPVARAAALGIPCHDPPAWRRAHEHLWRQIQAAVCPLLTALERRMVAAFFDRFLALLEVADFRPVLVHGDLNEEHALMDAEASRIVGVIDFGDMRLADAAVDFGQLPELFSRRMLQSYRSHQGPAEDDETFLARARCYGRLEAFRGVLMGRELGDRALLSSSLATLRRQLSEP